MHLIRHHQETPAAHKGAVYAIGNFDGVHRGHQVVIEKTRALATERNRPLGILTFEPHTRQVLSPEDPPFRLTPLRAKATQLAELGVDIMAALPFDKRIAALSAEDFVREVLIDGLGAAHVAIGYDFCFGRKRSGNAVLLRAMGAEHGFGVSVIDAVADSTAPEAEAFSSTRIRLALRQGNPREAARLLGHWWEIDGRVLPGARIGRTIGFPTANLALGDYLEPKPGIYAVDVLIMEDEAAGWRPGAAYFGRRPTVDGDDMLFEVHVLDFDGDLYGKHLRVRLHDFLRADRRFDGLGALATQIAADCDSARTRLTEADARTIPADPA